MRRATCGGVVVACLLVWGCSGNGGTPTLATVLDDQIDARLGAALTESSTRAAEWQPDARLRQVRLNVGADGAVSWRFQWLSDAGGAMMESHSNASLRRTGEDAEAASKDTLEIEATVGFASFAESLKANGVDLAEISPGQIQTIQLGHETHLDPPGFYYYLFLTSGEQHWVRASDATFVK